MYWVVHAVLLLSHCVWLPRQREEEFASIGARDMEATAQFEEDLQTLQASIDAEFGKDSDISGRQHEAGLLIQSGQLLVLTYRSSCRKW